MSMNTTTNHEQAVVALLGDIRQKLVEAVTAGAHGCGDPLQYALGVMAGWDLPDADESTPAVLDPVVEANRALLHKRSQVGISKYGVTLASANLGERELVVHALEEALDLSNYLQANLQRLDAAHISEDTASVNAMFNGFDITKLPSILISCVAKLWPGSHGMLWELALEKMPERIEQLLAARTPASVGSEAKGEAPGSIGDDAEFRALAILYLRALARDRSSAFESLVAYIDSRIAAAPERSGKAADESKLIPPRPLPDGCSPPFGDCMCSCHKMPGVSHIMPCCYPEAIPAGNSSAAPSDIPEAVVLLGAVFDAWENGDDCFEDGDPDNSFMGKCFQLDDDVFKRCCDLLNRINPPRNAPAYTNEDARILRLQLENLLANPMPMPMMRPAEFDAAAACHREAINKANAALAVVSQHRALATPAPTGESVSVATRDVLAERARQIGAEEMTLAGDDAYVLNELPRAAACYVLYDASNTYPAIWPWAKSWWKPKDDRRNYVRAAALLLAEIERIDRAAAKESA